MDDDFVTIRKSDLSSAKSVNPPKQKPLPTPTFKVSVSKNNNPIIKLTKWSTSTTHFGIYRLNSYSSKYELVKYAGKSFTDIGWNLQNNGKTKYKVQAVVMNNGKVVRKSELSDAVVANAVPKVAKSYNGKIIKVGNKVRLYDNSVYDIGGTVTKVTGDQVTFRIDHFKAGALADLMGGLGTLGGNYSGQNSLDIFNSYGSYAIVTIVTLDASELSVI